MKHESKQHPEKAGGGLPVRRGGAFSCRLRQNSAPDMPLEIEYQDIWEVFGSGSAAPYILEGYEDVWVEAGTFVKNELFTSGSLDGLSEMVDELHRQALSSGTASVHVVTVPEDLTHPQTVQLMADLLLGAGGDVAVVSDGGAMDGVPNTGGVSGRLYAGELDHDGYTTCIPGNSGKALVTLTGEELFRLLENGRTMTYEDKSAVFDYYWAGRGDEGRQNHLRHAVGRQNR